MPWRELYPDLAEKLDRLEQAQREDHGVLMGLVARVDEFAKSAGVEFAAIRQGQREEMEAVDGLHAGAMAVAEAATRLAGASLDAVPPWLGKWALGVLGAILIAVLGDLAVHAVHALLGG